MSDLKKILDDFKKVYTQETKTAVLSELITFKENWKKYSQVIKSLEKNSYLFTYYDFPKEIRSSIYTTNMIEGFNKQLKRKTKRKEQFPTEESLEKFIVSIFEDYNA